jgi:hypothetical protein
VLQLQGCSRAERRLQSHDLVSLACHSHTSQDLTVVSSRCTAQFCMVCAAPWKTCNCPWFNYQHIPDDDRLNDMRVPYPQQARYADVEVIEIPWPDAPASAPTTAVNATSPVPSPAGYLLTFATRSTSTPRRPFLPSAAMDRRPQYTALVTRLPTT